MAPGASELAGRVRGRMTQLAARFFAATHRGDLPAPEALLATDVELTGASTPTS